MATQNSIISYTPQPYYDSGTATIAGYTAINSIENTGGIFDPDLSNYTTVVPNISAATFAVKIDFNKQSAHLTAIDLSLAFIGCSLLTYENSGGSPVLASEFSENINAVMSSNVGALASELASFAHNSQDNIQTFDATAMPSVISGGRANLLFNGIGYSTAGSTATAYLTVTRSAADVAARPHARLILGNLFIGVDIPVTIDPTTFSWTMLVENMRFVARDFGAISSDGTLVKRSAGEIIKIPNSRLIGSVVTAVTPNMTVSNVANYFDLIKVNTSYPLLFNPYPQGPVVDSTMTIGEANLTARQNFFSIYGFMEDPLELLPGEFRDGLNSEYRARFRIVETR